MKIMHRLQEVRESELIVAMLKLIEPDTAMGAKSIEGQENQEILNELLRDCANSQTKEDSEFRCWQIKRGEDNKPFYVYCTLHDECIKRYDFLSQHDYGYSDPLKALGEAILCKSLGITKPIFQ